MLKLQRISFKCGFVFLFLIFFQLSGAQQFAIQPSNVYRPDRLKGVLLSEAALGAVASIGLYYLWYRKFPRSRFHYFNDNKEWMQIDKVGHLTSAYTIALVQNDLMRWCGIKPGPSIIIGSATALTYMSIIEVMDGFSDHWGFSKGDMLANIAGTAIFATQQKWWKEQRVSLKFSFHASPFAKYNPGELGNNWKSKLLKDYNGQTYWLSINIKSFLPAKSEFPAWANMALGYGAEGMTGANENPTEIKGKPVPYFKRYRQFYISPDVDLFRINGSSLYNNAAYILRFLKFPAPALEFNTDNRFKFHPFYY
ncbi:MAG TPA: DUF2279 domain-containing protein [Flavisolibacter sp.]|nr:DUF2279 domain-containing protein [Flavisolibacter sp.]